MLDSLVKVDGIDTKDELEIIVGVSHSMVEGLRKSSGVLEASCSSLSISWFICGSVLSVESAVPTGLQNRAVV